MKINGKKTTVGNHLSAMSCLDVFINHDNNEEFIVASKRYMMKAKSTHISEMDKIMEELHRLNKMINNMDNNETKVNKLIMNNSIDSLFKFMNKCIDY